MNKDRRKQLESIVERIEEIKALVEALRDEEQGAFDNLPEGLQQSDRGQGMEAAVEQLEAAISALEETSEAIGVACST